MNDQTTEKDPTQQDPRHGHHGHCGPSSSHRKMWMYGPMMAAKMASRGFRSSSGRGSGRARRWMEENPSDDQIIAFLEEHQRDLEQQIEDVRSRIEDLKSHEADG